MPLGLSVEQLVVLGIALTAWLAAVIWLLRDTQKEADRQERLVRSSRRDMPPRSPARKKRGW